MIGVLLFYHVVGSALMICFIYASGIKKNRLVNSLLVLFWPAAVFFALALPRRKGHKE